MTEIVLSFFYIFIFLILFSYPFNIFNLSSSSSGLKVNIFDTLLLNIIIHLNFLLILSFINFNLNFIFTIELLIGILFFTIYFVKYLNFAKKNYLLILYFVIFCFALFLSISSNPILTWDGVEHWFFKAQVYYQGGTYSQLKDLPYDYYPHLGAYIWAYFWKNSLINLEYFGRFFFVFFFIVAIFSLIQELNRKFSTLERLFVSLVIIYLCTDLFLFGGYQEYLLFCFLYIISRLFKILVSKNSLNKIYILFFIILANFLILWTKQEGFFYYIILNLIFTLYFKIKLNYKILFTFFSFILFSLFILIKIHYFGRLEFQNEILNNNLINNLDFFVLFYKISFILKYLFISIVKYPIWILIIFSSFYLIIKTNYFMGKKFFFLFFLFSLILVFAIYIHTTYEIRWLLSTSLSRILFGLSGFFIILIVDFLNSIKQKKKF
jgi:hypothetical protein